MLRDIPHVAELHIKKDSSLNHLREMGEIRVFEVVKDLLLIIRIERGIALPFHLDSD